MFKIAVLSEIVLSFKNKYYKYVIFSPEMIYIRFLVCLQTTFQQCFTIIVSLYINANAQYRGSFA